MKFIASSLDSLTNNLVKGLKDPASESGRKLIGFEDYFEERYELLMRKGVYPYEHVPSWDKFKKTKLPPTEAFYSSLNLSSVSDDDYQHMQRVWNEFNIKNLGEYHNLYLRTDVVLLVNMSEAFKDRYLGRCLEHYGLDPAHFYTSPGLAWCTCLKKTGIKLELLTDPDMLIMFEHGIRGGITQAVNHYTSANNVYMEGLYDPEKESSYLQYLDVNNLYGWVMSQLLPT